MASSPSSSYAQALRTSWQTFSLRRKALWLAAVLIAVLHVGGLVAWVWVAPVSSDPNEALRPFNDLRVYTDAARALQLRGPLYATGPWGNSVLVYHYHPLFALIFSWLLVLPLGWLGAAGMLVQVAAYLAAWAVWFRIYQSLRLTRAAAVMIAWMPAALTFLDWYANLYYWNIVSGLILLTALLTWALIQERTELAVLLALPILLTKPYWLFPLILPLVLRRWKFLAKVLVGLLVAYGIANGVYLLLVGPAYGLSTLADYVTFLARIPQNYPWEGQSQEFVRLNHSWRQILYHYFGFQPWVPGATLAIQLTMLGAMGWGLMKAWRQRVTLEQNPEVAITFVWLGYLVAMAMLDQLWELGAGIVVFAWLQSAEQSAVRRWAQLFLGYAFSEVLYLLGTLVTPDKLIPHQFIPVTMLAILVLYGASLVWLYRQLSAPAPLEAGLRVEQPSL